MSFIVKITTTKSVLDWLCPHSCMGCGALGEVLCECCKKDILGGLNYCPVCQQVVGRGECENCELPFDGLFMCGWRDEVVGQMVEAYKYESKRALGRVLAELLDGALPEIAGEVVVVPLPTTGKHVRARGFDHTLLVAKRLAKVRGWKCQSVLTRAEDTVQVGANRKKRLKQAERAYEVRGRLKKEVTYVLFDDVWTTGASMRAAEKLLREAGARKIVGAVLAVSR